MWLAMNEALLTNHARFRIGSAINDLCLICGVYPEITLHILKYCVKAEEMWSSVGYSFIKTLFFFFFFQQLLKNWLEANISDETRPY